MKSQNIRQDLKDFILEKGAVTAKEACGVLGISQPTFSRAVNSMREEVLSIGSGRSIKYALKRNIQNLGTEIPIFIIEQDGSSFHLADLKFTKPKGIFVSPRMPNASARLYQDIPYWLDDLRPSGFLGRLIPRRHPELGYSNDIRLWSADACIHYWARLGWDLIGNLIIGESAFELYTKFSQTPPTIVEIATRQERYQAIAEEVLSLGAAGSSAGGEQPKFLAAKLETPVIVKFSPEGNSALHSRRRDLLICEHHCLNTLRAFGVSAAKSELIFSPNKLFLELERFDRVGLKGRRGIISLAALDSEFVGSGGSWKEIARALLQKKIITQEAHDQILWRYCFGLCIRNTDMHAGNLSFYAQGESLLGLAPIYDMLPMALAPVSEQIMPIQHTAISLLPSDKNIWATAKEAAALFWRQVEKDERIDVAVRSAAAFYQESL